MNNLKIVRRIGPHPHANGKETRSAAGCPDFFELNNGDFAIIGREMTAELRSSLPVDAACGPDERIVVVDRHIIVNAYNWPAWDPK